MISLKTIIGQLDQTVYKSMEELLIKNKAGNFLFLMQSYRNGDLSDEEIIKHLELNSNSFYVLKSRLYDKIQVHLAGTIYSGKEDLHKQMQQIPDMCYKTSREIAGAFLQKLEKDLLAYDMHNELLVVYSALKKINLNSDRYFHYSQLYNKHIAFGLSLEKAEEILGNFNRILAQYDFSKSKPLLEKLFFLRKEILDHFALNSSRQIEIIKNIIELQLTIFCEAEISMDYDPAEVLQHTRRKINELPDSDSHKKWELVLDYLCFEYFRKTNQNKAAQYFEKVDAQMPHLLLYNSVCLTSKFLVSKLRYMQEKEQIEELLLDDAPKPLVDPNDIYTKVLLGIYNAMLSYYSGNTKEAVNTLNEIINLFSFKDYFHINMEIKLTLSYFYAMLNDYDLADTISKSIYRKLKSEELDQYANALDLIKVLNAMGAGGDHKKNMAKQKDALTLF
ncbi:MAG: hypothetical protein ACXVP0_10280, partial [Bacteroidia bacterium]